MAKDILCGFVYCHGSKDFSVWEVDITPEEAKCDWCGEEDVELREVIIP